MLHQEWHNIKRFANSEVFSINRLLKGLSELVSSIILSKTSRTARKSFEKIKSNSNAYSRVGKIVTVRVGKISLRVGSCPPLPTLTYATELSNLERLTFNIGNQVMTCSSHILLD